MDKIDELMKGWNYPYKSRTMVNASELINLLQIELAGKDAVIKALHEDIAWYRKDKRDEMIQDQGLIE
jgi:hypothetical protein